MVHQVKVSIIIPVFNVETFLRQCLESVIHQTLTELEIICINDGSTDQSLHILEEYAAKDNRIIILDKENGGQGLARNLAMQRATGEYVGFVDGDDWINPNMFFSLYTSAKQYDADVTICEFQLFNTAKGLIPQTEWFKLPIHKKFDHIAFRWADISEVGFHLNSGPVNKLFKNDFIRQHTFTFATDLYYEDIPFVFPSLIRADKISLVRAPFYFYRYSRPGSTTADKGKRQFEIFEILQILQTNIEHFPGHEKIRMLFYAYKFNQLFFHCREIDTTYKVEFWENLKTEFNKLDSESRKCLRMHAFLIKLGRKRGCQFFKVVKYLERLRFQVVK